MDGDGISSSDDVSSTADEEGPGGADPELTEANESPPMDLSPENILAQFVLYDRNMLSHMVHSDDDDPNMEATEAFVVVFGPRDDDHPRHGDGDAGAYDDGDYGSFVLGAVPASDVAIACLPETTVGEGDGEARESGQCAVCLDEYQAGDALRTMPCAHGFHERCIVKWLRASRLCPLCRFALPPEEEDTETDEEEEDNDNEREAGHHHDDDGGALYGIHPRARIRVRRLNVMMEIDP